MEPLDLPHGAAGVEIPDLLGIGRRDETGRHLRHAGETAEDGDVLPGVVPLPDADVHGEALSTLDPRLLERTGFDQGVARVFDPGAVGEEEAPLDQPERPRTERRLLDLEAPGPPEVRLEEPAVRLVGDLSREVVELEMLGLEEEPLVPEEGAVDGHFFSFTPWISSGPRKTSSSIFEAFFPNMPETGTGMILDARCLSRL